MTLACGVHHRLCILQDKWEEAWVWGACVVHNLLLFVVDLFRMCGWKIVC
jgi:hypothetical protein